MTAEGPCRYQVDAHDRIVALSPGWHVFAVANGAPELADDTVLGRPLWEFIAGAETVHLYQVLFHRVRALGASLTVPLRCDSPDRRRFMELDLEAAADQGVGLAGRLLREERRDPVPLFDRRAHRGSESLAMCGWCKRVLVGERWIEVEDAIASLDLFRSSELPRITHGICHDCRSRLLEELA